MSDTVSLEALRELPPMLFGRIRWAKGLGAPVGDPCTGFAIFVEERSPTEFRYGPTGPEPIPGTGIWRTVFESAPCYSLPDDEERHMIGFSVPDVHVNGFPDGAYHIKPRLTGNWGEGQVQPMLGFRRIAPLSYMVSLTKERHIRSVDFEVVHQPGRLYTFW